jgi:drug/metabolite transporter (DMT)-like permease
VTALDHASVGPVSAFLSSVTWAVAATVYSRLALKSNAFAVNVTRALFALPCFLVAAAIGARDSSLVEAFSIPAGNALWLAVSVVGSYALGDALFFRSTHALGVPGALSIASTYPLWSAVAGWLVRGEAMSGAGVAGLLMVVGGVVTVIRARGEGGAGERSGRALGVLLALATSVFWAFNAYAISRGGIGVAPAVANTIRMATVLAVVPLAARLSMGPGSPLAVPAADARKAAWLFVLEGFGGSMLFLLGMTRSPLAIGTALSSLAPVVAVPFAVLSGRERFSLATTAGVVLVVSGIVLLVGARPG